MKYKIGSFFILILLLTAAGCEKKPVTLKEPKLSVYEAAGAGDIELLLQHIKYGSQLSKRETPQLLAPLHNAVREEQVETTALLVEAGAVVAMRDRLGMTPLYYAAVYGDIDIAVILINSGADVNAKAKYGSVPLPAASVEGHLAMVKLLIDHNANVNAVNIPGDTPLISAADHAQIHIVKLLLEKGANINSIDNKTGGYSIALCCRDSSD